MSKSENCTNGSYSSNLEKKHIGIAEENLNYHKNLRYWIKRLKIKFNNSVYKILQPSLYINHVDSVLCFL